MGYIFPIAFLCITIMGAFAYRIRGGGWFTLEDSWCRIIWGTWGLSCPYMVLATCYGTALILPFILYALLIVALGYAAMYVPHAAYQNMGRWATPQKTWPGFFLPTITTVQWTAMPMWERSLHDFFGMMGVGFFRGLIVFGPFAVVNTLWIYPQIGWFLGSLSSICAIAVITILSPVAYLIGFYVPFSLTSSLTARSAQWGEFLQGAAWVVALWVL